MIALFKYSERNWIQISDIFHQLQIFDLLRFWATIFAWNDSILFYETLKIPLIRESPITESSIETNVSFFIHLNERCLKSIFTY